MTSSQPDAATDLLQQGIVADWLLCCGAGRISVIIIRRSCRRNWWWMPGTCRVTVSGRGLMPLSVTLWVTAAAQTSCARGDTICLRPSSPRRAPPRRRNIAVLSHAEYVPTLTAAAALCVKAVLSKAAWWPWPLTFWPWKWCRSHVWSGLHLCQFWPS